MAFAGVVVCTGLLLTANILLASGGVKSIKINRDGSMFEFTSEPVQTLHMSLPNAVDMTVTHGAKNEYRMTGDSAKGIVTFASGDGRKTDVYAYEPDGKQLKNTITYANGTGMESEVYEYQNVVLHKTAGGNIEGFFRRSKSKRCGDGFGRTCLTNDARRSDYESL